MLSCLLSSVLVRLDRFPVDTTDEARLEQHSLILFSLLRTYSAGQIEDPHERFVSVLRYYLAGWHIKPKGV